MYIVKIIRYSDDGLEYTIECKGMSERQAQQVESGVNHNLNHEEYYTELVLTQTNNNSCISDLDV